MKKFRASSEAEVISESLVQRQLTLRATVPTIESGLPVPPTRKLAGDSKGSTLLLQLRTPCALRLCIQVREV